MRSLSCRTILLVLVSIACVVASESVWADYRETVLSSGPIGYWTLDETEGEVAPNLGLGRFDVAFDGAYFGDESIRGAAGPDRDAGFLGFGEDNRALRLDEGIDVSGVGAAATEDGVGLLDDLAAFTLSGWINPTNHEGSNRAGLFGQDNVIEFGFIGPSTIQMWAELPGGGDIHINHDYQKPNDEWTHIALTGDGENGPVSLYIDGEPVGLAEDNSMPLADLGKESYGVSGNPFNIGGGAIFGGDTQFVGGVDEVAVFDRALPAEEVRSHFVSAFSESNTISGDFNGDGAVNLEDFAIMTDNFNQPGDATTGDMNFSLTVDLGDFILFREVFNSPGEAAGVANVPEPAATLSAIALFLSTCLAAFRRRKTWG